MDDISGFFRQVPVGLILAPIFFGALYIILLVVIFQRGAARRRKRREEKAQMQEALGRQQTYSDEPSAVPTSVAPVVKPKAPPAPKPAKNAIPEPDLDLLIMPPTFHEIVPATSTGLSTTPDADWMSALALPPDQPDQIVEIDMNKPTSDPTDAVEVMRVWRDLSDGTLIIQMGDRRYRSLAEINNSPDLVRRFTAVVRELWGMVNGGGAAARVAPSESAAPLPSPEGSMGMKARIGLLKDQLPEETPPRPSVLRQIGRTVTGQPATPPRLESTGSGGIADAVEEFLQFKLTGHPEFAQRSIHIRPSIDGGVRIEVDGNSYQGIGDVVDPDVREFLFGVMKEWEARQ